MAPTIPIEVPAPRGTARTAPWGLRDSLLAATLIFLGLALLILAGTQLVSQLSRIPANSYYSQHQARFLDSENGVSYLQEAGNRLKRIPPQRRGEEEWRRLAATELLQPTDDETDETDEGLQRQRQASINTAVTATLTQAPVQPLGWAYLADLRLPPSGDCREAMAALRQSYRVAPIEPDLVPYRLELAVRCPRQWSPALLNAMRADLHAFYAPQNNSYGRDRAFITWLKDQPQVQALVQRLLRDQPEGLNQFERALKRFSR